MYGFLHSGWWRNTEPPGLAAGFYATLGPQCPETGFGDCEMSWILEDNVLMNRSLEVMGAKRYKTYRIYEWN